MVTPIATKIMLSPLLSLGPNKLGLTVARLVGSPKTPASPTASNLEFLNLTLCPWPWHKQSCMPYSLREPLVLCNWAKTFRARNFVHSAIIVRPYHCFHVLQLVKEHQFDCDESVVIGTHIPHIALELRWEVLELCELCPLGDEPSRVGRV